MSTTLLPEPRVSPSPPELPDASSLQDRVPEGIKAPRVLAVMTLAVGALYWFCNYRPLWHTDLWGHLSYGRHIWQAGRLPLTEPLMPLAKGVHFVGTEWLSQLLGYAVMKSAGVAGLQALYALSISLCAVLLLAMIHRRTHRAAFSLLGLVAFLWGEWQQLLIVRPQLAGLVCFLVLLTRLTERRPSRWDWAIIPATVALWANLHGSFVVGIGLVGCFCAGRAIDLLRKTRSPRAVWRDGEVRRTLLLTELAAAAALLNPYGVQLYAEVLTFSSNPNLAVLLDWQPLHLRMAQGQAMAAIALALMLVYRLTPRRITATEVLLLVGLGLAAMWTSRLIVWWAPIAAWCLAVHASAVWKSFRRHPAAAPSPRNGRWTVVTVGLVWIFFAYTPFGLQLLHGRAPDIRKAVSPLTPIDAVEYLQKHPPQGQVFNTYEWGDYLLWAGPPDVQVFVASHAHLIPTDVWRHYLEVSEGGSGWDATLDLYGVNTVVVDPIAQAALVRRLREHEQWKLGFENRRSVVFHRREPIL